MIKTMKVRVFLRPDNMVDVHVATRLHDGQIMYGHIGNCPIKEFESSLLELTGFIEKGIQPADTPPALPKADGLPY